MPHSIPNSRRKVTIFRRRLYKSRIVHAVGVLAVSAACVYLVWPSFGFAKMCWWHGFFSSMYSLSSFCFAVLAIAASIGGVFFSVKAIVRQMAADMASRAEGGLKSAEAFFKD